MTNIDQFESVFKAADKPAFSHESINIESVLIASDLENTDDLLKGIQSFLATVNSQELSWECLSGEQSQRVDQVLEKVQSSKPDLICGYRNLHVPSADYPYSLGVYIDVLTQATQTPVLLFPHPDEKWWGNSADQGTRSVMAVTDHLAGDHHLVSYAAEFVDASGKLLLAHVEDEQTFERYIKTISRIPAIDTDSARELILQQLLKEPHDFIRSCRDVLEAEGLSFEVNESVTLGHHLSDYKRLIDEHDIDLVVMNTKDEDQLAMHGVAYPLSVELRDTPLLLL